MTAFDQTWVLLKENWYDHYPTEGMSMTNRQLEGKAERAITRLIDHPNWETFKEAGHPWERVEEFFGLEGKQLNDASSAFMEESIFREKEDDRPHIDDTDIDFAPEVFMEHKRHNIVNHPDGGHSHEMLPTFGNVNINQPSMADGVAIGSDMQNIPLRDGEEDMFSPWNERYGGQRIGPHSRTPFSEQDQMKYASEPFDKAWDVLKSSLYPELHPEQTTLGQYHADFPSRAGPMSMMRVVPSEYMQDIDNRGLQPLPQNANRGYGDDNSQWEDEMAGKDDKKFDTTRGGGKGFWVTKPDFRNVTPAYAGATPSEKGMGHSMVGIRMTPEDAKNLDAQWRNAKRSPEGFPEGLIHEAIDPHRLVMMRQGKNVGQPMNWHDESTWGNVPRDIKDLAYEGGVGETERPDMWDWETE